MKLIKTSFFSAIITFIRISSGFIVSKFVAFFIGPSGIALIGQFSNFISVVLTFSNGAINNGVIKYTSEYRNDLMRSKSLFGTATRISLYCSVLIGTILVLFSNYFSFLILKSGEFSTLMKVFGFNVLFYSLNTLLVSIINGKEDIKKFTIVNSSGVLVGLSCTIILVYFFKIQGALYSLILSQSVVFFITLYLISKTSWFKFSYFKSSFNRDIAKKLGGFSLMAIASAVTVPISQILLRNLIINKFGVDSAGIWQGMIRISDGYLMLVITTLSIYYLPKLSALESDKAIGIEVIKGLKIIIPIVFFCSLIIYFLRFFLIELLYSNQFIEMEHLFIFQLMGDILKIASWLVGYIMVAKAMTKAFIAFEFIFNFLYVGFGYLFIYFFGLNGATIAFFLNYLLSFLFLVVFFRKVLFMSYALPFSNNRNS